MLYGVVKTHVYFVGIHRSKWSALRGRVQKFPACHITAAPNGKCCEGYIAPSTVRLLYQFQAATCSLLTILKNSEVVLFLSKVGQAGNFWILPRI